MSGKNYEQIILKIKSENKILKMEIKSTFSIFLCHYVVKQKQNCWNVWESKVLQVWIIYFKIIFVSECQT